MQVQVTTHDKKFAVALIEFCHSYPEVDKDSTVLKLSDVEEVRLPTLAQIVKRLDRLEVDWESSDVRIRDRLGSIEVVLKALNINIC